MVMVRAVLSTSFIFLLCITGCGISTESISNQGIKIVLTGNVHGGQQPVSGSTVQLYAVSNNGDGSASTPLISSTVITDSNGSFNITGDYSCPSQNTLVYITATGGNPGLSGTVNNKQISLIALLGNCGNLTSSTYINVDEVTTVSAVGTLNNYISNVYSIGSSASDYSGLVSDFTTSSELVNTQSGTSPGTNIPLGYTVPVTSINTISDIVAACINSNGGVEGDGSVCGNLFSYVDVNKVGVTDTVTALIQLFKNPSSNITQLYDLIPASAQFVPYLSTQPSNFSIALQSNSPTPVLAVGLKILMASYNGPAIRVQRLSDNAQIDINFTSNNGIDTNTLNLFLGNSTGYIVRLYDQSGYHNDVTQTTAMNAPTISMIAPTTITINNNTYVTARSVIQSSAEETPLDGPGYWNLPANISLNTLGTTAILGYEPDFSGGEGFEEYNLGNSSSTTFDLVRSFHGYYGLVAGGNAWLTFGSDFFPRSQPTVIALETNSSYAPKLYIDSIEYDGIYNVPSANINSGILLGGPNSNNTTFANFLSFELYNSTLTQSQVSTISNQIIPRTPSTVNIVADGDSITEGHCSSYGRNTLRYAETQLSKNSDIYNISLGGTTSTQLLPDTSYPTVNSSKIGMLYQPNYSTNIYYIAVGTNDLHGYGITPQTTWSNIQSMVANAKSLGYETVIATVLHENGETTQENSDVNSINSLIRASAGTANVDAVVDYDANPYLAPGTFYPSYSCDGVHPNDAGYSIMGQTAAVVLNKLIK